MNIVAEIFRNADRRGIALVAGGIGITFGELERMTDLAADALGSVAGKRVGLNCPNGIDHIVWSLAVLRCNAVLIPVAPELSHSERDDQVRATALQMVLCAGGRSWHRQVNESRSLVVAGLQPAVLLCGLTSEPTAFSEQTLVDLNPALIRFSSGTTGARKGVVLSHETLLARVRASNTRLGFGPGDRVIWILPMAHHFAVSIILYLLHGVTTVLEESHLGEDVFRALSKHQGTALYASPFHYALLASFGGAHAVPSLRIAVSTAATLPADTSERFLRVFGLPLRQALGIIECGLPTINDLWPVEKSSSVGRPQEGYSVSIRDEKGCPLERGEIGELFVRGPGLVDAYLSPWITRENILEEGWFRTGDLARQDGDGALFIVGRTHAVINVGGMKCFPEEVEAVLCSHPDVADCRVSPLFHPTFGSVPVAEVVLSENAQVGPKASELMGWCRTRISSYKLPVKISFVTALPKTASGKTLR